MACQVFLVASKEADSESEWHMEEAQSKKIDEQRDAMAVTAFSEPLQPPLSANTVLQAPHREAARYVEKAAAAADTAARARRSACPPSRPPAIDETSATR